MRIGVISDTHIPERAKTIPKEIINGFKNVDMIIHAGDLVDISVIERLSEICGCANVKAVWGNMDPDSVKSKLPEKELLKIGKFKVGIMHGFGAPANIINTLSSAFKDDHPDIIIFGHSHASFNKKIGDTLFFNPGSATDKIFSSENSYGIIEINDHIKAEVIKI